MEMGRLLSQYPRNHNNHNKEEMAVAAALAGSQLWVVEQPK